MRAASDEAKEGRETIMISHGVISGDRQHPVTLWGGLEVWESLGGIVLGLAVAVLGLMWLSRNAAKGPGAPADDDALRDEIRKWQHGRHDR